jgi:hypothetical protein
MLKLKEERHLSTCAVQKSVRLLRVVRPNTTHAEMNLVLLLQFAKEQVFITQQQTIEMDQSPEQAK